MRYKINEIFVSIQGEGFHTGLPCIFVRFAGCNLECDFCDTDHSENEALNIAELLQRIVNLRTVNSINTVVLTGGEPMLQLNVTLVNLLKNHGFKIHLETNGTIDYSRKEYFNSIDWITVSPKDPNIPLRSGSELKIVDTGQALTPYRELANRFDHCYLQPCWSKVEVDHKNNIESTVNRIMKDPIWKLSVQLHKFVNIK